MLVCDCPALRTSLGVHGEINPGTSSCVSLCWSQDQASFCEISPENVRPELNQSHPQAGPKCGAMTQRNRNMSCWQRRRIYQRIAHAEAGGASRSRQRRLTRWLCGVAWPQFHPWPPLNPSCSNSWFLSLF